MVPPTKHAELCFLHFQKCQKLSDFDFAELCFGVVGVAQRIAELCFWSMVPPQKMRKYVSAQWCRRKKCGIMFLINGVSTEAAESCFWSMVPERRCPNPDHGGSCLWKPWVCLSEKGCLKEESCLRSPRMVVSKSCQYGGCLRWVPRGLGYRARVLALSARSPSVSGWLASAVPA